MITGPKNLFLSRCRERGYSLDDVRPCIVSEDADTITVDEMHPAYPRQPRQGVSLLAKATNFALAASRHVANGMRRASDEEIAYRFSICETCEHFDGKSCGKCGCPVVREKRYISKLSWAGESCPVGKWGPAS